MATLAIVLTGIGLVLDIVGVFLMARPYVHYADSIESVAALLWSSLIGTAEAKGAQALAKADSTDNLANVAFRPVLQGLALLGVGFVFQIAGQIASLSA